MNVKEYNGFSVTLDGEGFMTDPSQWNPDVARAIAAEVGIAELTDQHWTVITFCREDNAKEGQPPGLRRISKQSTVGMKELYKLFPKGPGKLAARISGLPKPKACI